MAWAGLDMWSWRTQTSTEGRPESAAHHTHQHVKSSYCETAAGVITSILPRVSGKLRGVCETRKINQVMSDPSVTEDRMQDVRVWWAHFFHCLQFHSCFNRSVLTMLFKDLQCLVLNEPWKLQSWTKHTRMSLKHYKKVLLETVTSSSDGGWVKLQSSTTTKETWKNKNYM